MKERFDAGRRHYEKMVDTQKRVMKGRADA